MDIVHRHTLEWKKMAEIPRYPCIHFIYYDLGTYFFKNTDDLPVV